MRWADRWCDVEGNPSFPGVVNIIFWIQKPFFKGKKTRQHDCRLVSGINIFSDHHIIPCMYLLSSLKTSEPRTSSKRTPDQEL